MITDIYCVWYVTPDNRLSYIDYRGTLQECANIVRARLAGCWAILPSEE